MKIINPGNATTTYRFHCKCGCAYEVAEWELQHSSEDCKFWHKGLLITFPRHSYTHCPRCGNKILTCYAEIVDSADTFAETITERETKSESTENCCENCYEKCVLNTRDSSSKFYTIPDKPSSTETGDHYKSETTNIIERSELTKLRVSVKFLQKYCEDKHGCKGCPFGESMDGGCGLAKTPALWNTDF